MQDEDVGRGMGERVCLMQTARTQDNGWRIDGFDARELDGCHICCVTTSCS
jgi:hypothetical protein